LQIWSLFQAVKESEVIIMRCPFHDGDCKFPDMFDKIPNENFCGCEIVEFIHGNKIVHWSCPYFPIGWSITRVRDAFDRLRLSEKSIRLDFDNLLEVYDSYIEEHGIAEQWRKTSIMNSMIDCCNAKRLWVDGSLSDVES